MRKYSCIQVTARSEYCCRCSVGIREEARKEGASVAAESAEENTSAKPVAEFNANEISIIAIHPPNSPKRPDLPAHAFSFSRFAIPNCSSNFSLPNTPTFHAVFISGLPKLPCPTACGVPTLPLEAYNVFRYQ